MGGRAGAAEQPLLGARGLASAQSHSLPAPVRRGPACAMPPRGRFSTTSAAIPEHQVFIGVWFHVARGIKEVSGAAHGQLEQLVRGVCTERGEPGLQLGQGWLGKAGEAIEMEEENRVGVRGGHN